MDEWAATIIEEYIDNSWSRFCEYCNDRGESADEILEEIKKAAGEK